MTAEELADRLELLIAARIDSLTSNWSPPLFGWARANELVRLRNQVRSIVLFDQLH
jgi:hypothetical protein